MVNNCFVKQQVPKLRTCMDFILQKDRPHTQKNQMFSAIKKIKGEFGKSFTWPTDKSGSLFEHNTHLNSILFMTSKSAFWLDHTQPKKKTLIHNVRNLGIRLQRDVTGFYYFQNMHMFIFAKRLFFM